MSMSVGLPKLLRTNRKRAPKVRVGEPKFRVGAHEFMVGQSLEHYIFYLTIFKQVFADISGTF